MSIGIIIEAAEYIASLPVSELPTDEELTEKFGLDRGQCMDARRASVDARARREIERNTPRYYGCLTGKDYGGIS